MKDKKLTDAEIVKAWEVIKERKRIPSQYLIDNTFDLINLQKAENERLENTIIALMNYLDILGVDKTDTSFVKEATELNKQIRADIKAEAYKEFADRLKEIFKQYWFDYPIHVFCDETDNLLKELVGE